MTSQQTESQKKPLSQKTKFFLGGIALLAALFLIIVRPFHTPEGPETVSVVRTNIVESVTLSGRTEAQSSVDLSFADGGRVDRIFVTEGQDVQAGQLLATLETNDLEASLRDARAERIVQEANRDSNTVNLSTAARNFELVEQEESIRVRNALRSLLSTGLQAEPEDFFSDQEAPTISGTYTSTETGDYILEVYGSAANSGASFRLIGDSLEAGFIGTVAQNTAVPLGTRGLFIQFFDESYVNTKWRVSIPNMRSSQYVTLRSNYESAQALGEVAIARAEAELDRERALATQTERSSLADARILRADAQIELIQASILKRQIRAPYDGVITDVLIDPGQAVSPAQTMIRMNSNAGYEVSLDVPEIDISKVATGNTASIVLEAFGRDRIFSGRVGQIFPAETVRDGVPVYETQVLFDNLEDAPIRSGMTAFVTLETQLRENVLALPFRFIVTKDNEQYVWVQSDPEQAPTKASITTGLLGSNRLVEITSGLSEGMIIVDPTYEALE
jgi:HlyD family secretion protein